MAMVCMVTVFYHFIFLNQMKVSIFYTVFYGIIVHFLITMIFTNSSLFSQFFYVILYSIYALLADVVSAMLPVVLFHENINRVLSGGWVRAVFTLVYLILLGVLIGLTIMIGKQNICLRTKEKLIFIGIALLCVAIEQIDMIAVVRALQQSRGNDFFMLVTIFVFVLFLFMIMLLFIYNLGVEREKIINCWKRICCHIWNHSSTSRFLLRSKSCV